MNRFLGPLTGPFLYLSKFNNFVIIVYMKVLLVGGGTGGSVSPLLAVAKNLRFKKPEVEFMWLGSKSGPEKKMVTSADIDFKWILAGKLRRYFSWRNFIDPFFIIVGFFQSFFILKEWRPQVVVSAGSFIAVPTSIAAWILRIPVLIHQQDLRPGLTNKILSWVSKRITITFPESQKYFPKNKTVVTGNPIRGEILMGDRDRGKELFNLQEGLSTILIVGGGTGALKINQMVVGALPELLNFCQVIHITGAGKKLPPLAIKEKEELYHPFEFIMSEMPDALAVADIVITRAGLGFLTELAALGKPTIIIPIPKSHQEDNARYFCERGAAICLQQNSISSQSLAVDIQELLLDSESLSYLRRAMNDIYNPQATDLIVSQILELINR